MGEYDLQKYLNYLSVELTEGNDFRERLLKNSNRIQGEYTYAQDHECYDAEGIVKEARALRRRGKKKLHSSPKQRAPRYDKRSHKDEPKKLSKPKKEETLEQEIEKTASSILQRADKFSIMPPKTAKIKTAKQMEFWNKAIEKAAFKGNLLTPDGTPNYKYLLSEYSKIANISPGVAVDPLDFAVGDWVTKYNSVFPGMVVGVHPSLEAVDIEYPTGWEREDPEELILFPLVKDSLQKTKNDVALVSRMSRSLQKRASREQHLEALLLSLTTKNENKKQKIASFITNNFDKQAIDSKIAEIKKKRQHNS